MRTGAILRGARERAGLSQRELARRSGVPHSVISAIETGQRDPSVSLLDRLLGALGERLVSEASVPSDPDPRGEELRQVLRLASLLPHDARIGQPLTYPRLPRRSA